MGEIAEMMLDGTMCQGCGEFLHDGEDGDGIPAYCAGCEPEGQSQATPGRWTSPGKRLRNKRRRARLREKRKAILHAADTTGWEKKSDYHFQREHNGEILNWWPSTGKWCRGNVPQSQPLNEFLKEGAKNGNEPTK